MRAALGAWALGAAAAFAQGGVPESGVAGKGPAAAPAAPVSTAPASMQAVVPGAQPEAAAVPEAANPYQVVFSPKTLRDPMLSETDYRLIKEAEEKRKRDEEEARRKALEALNAPQAQVKRAPAKPPIQTRIDLQGVVETPRGVSAIINGEVYLIGDRFRVPGYAGSVSVLDIGGDRVVLSHAGRQFRKSIPR